MAVLQLLAENGNMTASAIAEAIGIHQSSASRLLKSLVDSGFVYKPDFHSFALDYGVILFAGQTLESFPIVQRSTVVCNKLSKKYDFSSTVAVLFQDRVVYLTRCAKDNFRLVDNNSFPLYCSSVGRLLAYQQGRARMIEIVNKSIEKNNVDESAEAIYDEVDESVKKYGFLYMPNKYLNKLNCAMCFKFDKREACLAIFSEVREATAEEISPILIEAVAAIKGENNVNR
jgi:DNA-binding IclR family transcriptional regulator